MRKIAVFPPENFAYDIDFVGKFFLFNLFNRSLVEIAKDWK